MKKFFLITGFVCLVTACATVSTAKEHSTMNKSNGSTEDAQLVTDRYYELVGIKGPDEFIVIEPEHGGGGLISFGSDGTVSATSGINRGYGQYRYKKLRGNFDELRISQMGVTLMLGANEQENLFDRLFFQHLNDCKYIQCEGSIIKLYDADKTNLLNFYLKK